MADQELKACPICGGAAKMYYPFHMIGSPNVPATYRAGVECTACGHKSGASTPPDASIFAWNARPEPEPTAVKAGELDPKIAANRARQCLRYIESFNGQTWSVTDQTDRRNLATALDNLTECAAMLLNLADRRAAPSQPVADAATQQAVAASNEPLPYWEPCNPGCDPEFNGERTRYCGKLCEGARTALASTNQPVQAASSLKDFTPAAYRVWGITGSGKTKVEALKPWPETIVFGEEPEGDDDGLGEWWAGVEKLYSEHDVKKLLASQPSAPTTVMQVEVSK